ncbi:MAG: BamA/TamA family outer membrane protein [Chitinophagaceae bacterium]|nr:BamA/TamA family outer membrane protein [Chitinophagaceae bacterium]
MSAAHPFGSKNFLLLPGVIFLIFLASCGVVPKNYPVKRPFVFKYNVTVDGNLTTAEKNELESRLSKQLDDSIQVRTARKFIYKGINRPVLDKPPVYDVSNAESSVVYMQALLRSLGYFKDTITYKATIDTVAEDQYRTTVNFFVNPGKVVLIDSFSYNIRQSDLQKITLANQADALVKKGSPFAKSIISVELDRLVELYRNNGYMRFGREELIGLWDTLDVSLLRPTFDPLEQLEILQKLKERRENPTANLEIMLRPGFDSSKLTKYFIGRVTVFPDFNADTASYTRKEVTTDGVKVIYYRNIIKPKILPPNIYFHHGDLYNQKKYLKTITRFNSLGAWRLVNIEQIPRTGQDTADFTIKLTPARKYSFTANLEGSRNQNAISGNLFGIAVNVGLQNRNFARAANQSNTNIRFGIETGRDKATNVKFVQTRQISLSHNIYFPRPVLIDRLVPKLLKENARTVFSFNAAGTERRSLYNLTTINLSWGYEFQWNKSSLSFRFPNIEYSLLKRRSLLDTLFKYNPALKNIFTDGFISSGITSYTLRGGRKNNLNLFRTNMELCGLVSGLIKKNKFLDSNLYRFIKLDAEFIQKIQFKKTAIALRFFAGAGYEFNSTVQNDKRANLPFFKQYFSGGPNSMRAWALRKLGPGSAIKDFSLNPERYGDVQIEFNAEYRFPLGKPFGIILNGAFFTDIGNIWFLKKAPGRLPEEIFNFSRLAKDLAVGVGAGLRIDFTFFVVRFDYSYKAKNPSPSPDKAAGQNKWFYGTQLFNGQFQLGVSYPFIL